MRRTAQEASQTLNTYHTGQYIRAKAPLTQHIAHNSWAKGSRSVDGEGSRTEQVDHPFPFRSSKMGRWDQSDQSALRAKEGKGFVRTGQGRGMELPPGAHNNKYEK